MGCLQQYQAEKMVEQATWTSSNDIKTGKNFNNDDDIESYLIQFFANKNHKFYERGIMMLPERWRKVIDQNGQRVME